MKIKVTNLLWGVKQLFKRSKKHATSKKKAGQSVPVYIEKFVLDVTLVVEKANRRKISTLKTYEELLKICLKHHDLR